MTKTNIIELRGVTKHFQDHQVLQQIDLSVKSGEFLTLLGPSGCGKTTLLRLLSGFDTPTEGKIFIAGNDVSGLPPHLRQVNTVFQSYALFPHMTVFENIAFGLRCKGIKNEEEIFSRVEEALEMVKLLKYAQRKPHQLSGGQQQRVAIARAVVNKPLVLLLDEPLSSLDYRLRKVMQIELKELQRRLGITFIFVTHDQEEALSMSDRVAVMNEGIIEQIGTPREVYEEPQTVYVADFIGEANIFTTEILAVENSHLTVMIEGKERVLSNRKGFVLGQKVSIVVRPEDLQVWGQSEVDDTSRMFPAVVDQVIYKGSTVDLMLRLPNNTMLAATQFFNEDDEKLDYRTGEPVWVDWIPGWEVILPHDA